MVRVDVVSDVADDVDDFFVVVTNVVEEVVGFVVVVEDFEDVDEVFELETELVVEDFVVVVVEALDDEVIDALDVEELLLDSEYVSSSEYREGVAKTDGTAWFNKTTRNIGLGSVAEQMCNDNDNTSTYLKWRLTR